MGTNGVQYVRWKRPDGKTVVGYSSRQIIDPAKDAVRYSTEQFAARNRGGTERGNRLGASVSFAWSWGGRGDQSNSPTVSTAVIKKHSSRREAALAKKYAPGQDSYQLKNGDDLKHYVDSHRDNFARHQYPDGRVEYRELGTGRLLKGKEYEQAMNKVLADTGEVYTIKNRGELVDVAKRTGIDINTLEKLNPELVGKKLTAGAQVRLKAEEAKEIMQAATPVTGEGIYTIKNGGQLKHVAMRTGIPVETLEKLNPEFKGKRLSAGTQVKLI